MSQERKISIRKIIQALLTGVLAVVCIVAITSASNKHQVRKLNGVDVQIENSKYGFVTKKEIVNTMLRDGELKAGITEVADVNVTQMEKVLTGNPWVNKAEVYIDNNAMLHAKVEQREPIVRIFEKNGYSYYLDKNKEYLPWSEKYTHYTMVVTNVPKLRNDSLSSVLKTKIVKMVDRIKQDSFWRAQVSQVILRDDLDFEIVPVLGDQQIIIGDTSDLDAKFDNLFTFYNEVLNKIGWDRYEVLDLSFKGQLVASPAVDWKLPKDKTIERINWVKTILGDDVKYTTVSRVAPKPTVATAKPKPEIEATNVEKEEVVKQAEKPVKETVIPQPKQEQPKEQTPKPENKKEDKQPKYIYGGNGN